MQYHDPLSVGAPIQLQIEHARSYAVNDVRNPDLLAMESLLMEYIQRNWLQMKRVSGSGKATVMEGRSGDSTQIGR
jgi:hypothetical protein